MQKNFIAGEWFGSDHSILNINPSDTSEVVGEFAQASLADLEMAIESARRAQPLWAATGLEQRQAALQSIGDELMARSAELGELLAREEGKTRGEGKGEVYRAGQFFTYFAAETLRQLGENADSVRSGIEVDIRREPVGVVGVISPWNFPIATASWKIAPALAFGNSVIWKPANLTPAVAVALTEIISRAGLPRGTFNLVMGNGKIIGDALACSPRIDAITFTGSLPIGRRVAAAAAANLVKVQLEMGSKNALVIMDDANLDLAVVHALNGAYGGTGQKCTASSRLVVHDRIYGAFVEKLIAGIEALRVGHALDPDSQIGPVASAEQLQSNLAYIASGVAEGAELACGGIVLDRRSSGYFMAPALFLNTHNQMRINREEIFGPIASTIKVGSFDEALEIVNDTPFGLVSGIMTTSLSRATHFRRKARTGCVMVNLPTAGTDYHVPFGGRGQSSYGSREQGRYAAEFYTTVKTSYISSGISD
ncbi:MAG: aldehyde dehydrogenase family protein [Alphaproteobacteria bacterium]|jgi:aldehyde dehydrogenase (NAD+)|nr:aldehyde dehydrogenase family protein [Alphaproteobacteria bacterium]